LEPGRTATIVAKVRRFNGFISPRNPNLAILELQLADATGRIRVSQFMVGKRFASPAWLNSQKRHYPPGASVAVSGLVKETPYGPAFQDPLIEVLESPMLLEPIAQRFGESAGSLAKSITITSGGSKQKTAEGVLKITITERDRSRGQLKLTALANAYLGYSLSQRQQRLAEGLRFLDRQGPILQGKTAEIQAQLAQFRRSNNLLEPTEEGLALKQQITAMELERRGLEAERSRLLAGRCFGRSDPRRERERRRRS
jgi:hypothetical protein